MQEGSETQILVLQKSREGLALHGTQGHGEGGRTEQRGAKLRLNTEHCQSGKDQRRGTSGTYRESERERGTVIGACKSIHGGLSSARVPKPAR